MVREGDCYFIEGGWLVGLFSSGVYALLRGGFRGFGLEVWRG
jgi:hypothetical protein